MTDFALDYTANPLGLKRWNGYSQAFGNPVLSFTTRDYSAYIQDQFRATSKLTLNFGIRYEYTDLPQPKVFNPNYPDQDQPHPEPSLELRAARKPVLCDWRQDRHPRRLRHFLCPLPGRAAQHAVADERELSILRFASGYGGRRSRRRSGLP